LSRSSRAEKQNNTAQKQRMLLLILYSKK